MVAFGWFLRYDRPVYLIAGTEETAWSAARNMALIGLDNVRGWFGPDVLTAYAGRSGSLYSPPIVSGEAALEAKGRADTVLLDVRGENERLSGHVPGSTHIPLGCLPHRASELPRDAKILVYCAAGSRSPIGVSVLRGLGFQNLAEVPGGFKELDQLGACTATATAT